MNANTQLFKAVVLAISMLSSGVAFAGSTTLNLSKDSTQTNPQSFYCEAGKGDDRIVLVNHGQMIKGFDKGGTLLIKGGDLNKVYFQAYHDSNYSDAGDVRAVSLISSIDCNLGMGKPGETRTLIKGSFGLR